MWMVLMLRLAKWELIQCVTYGIQERLRSSKSSRATASSKVLIVSNSTQAALALWLLTHQTTTTWLFMTLKQGSAYVSNKVVDQLWMIWLGKMIVYSFRWGPNISSSGRSVNIQALQTCFVYKQDLATSVSIPKFMSAAYLTVALVWLAVWMANCICGKVRAFTISKNCTTHQDQGLQWWWCL